MGLGLFGGGVGAARWLARRGWNVTVTDLKDAASLDPSLRALEGLPLTYRLGGHDPADFTSADLVVVNPAVRRDAELLALAARSGATLTSEIALFVEHCPARIVGVTGTRGKSTVTTLLADIVGRVMPTRMGGNIGRSLLDELDEIGPEETIVLELSSFQLHDPGRLEWSPRVAVVTNVSPNHLDWHGTMEAYVAAKWEIVRHQGPDDLAVLNADDPEVAAWAEAAPGRVLTYSAEGRPADVRAEGDVVVFGPSLVPEEERLDLAGRLHLRGRHNVANVLAAATAARALGAGLVAIAEAVHALRPLPHRLETVGRRGEVLFVDDSKATTPEAARAALEAFEQPVVLIAGGYDKRTDPSPMLEAARERARAVVLIGATADAIAEALRTGGPPVERTGSMEEAVARAVAWAEPGDVVLLAPGHASWDMFENYEARGRAFRRAAEAAGMVPEVL